MRPPLVVSVFDTITVMVSPTCAAACSITTIVPSTRYPTPWVGFSPTRRTSMSSRSPATACARNAPDSRCKFTGTTPAISATFARAVSVVTRRYPFRRAISTSARSTFPASISRSSMVTSTLGLACIFAIMSRPRRPRARRVLSLESASRCSSSITPWTTMNGASSAPESQTSIMRPSMMELVSSSIGRTPRFCLENST